MSTETTKVKLGKPHNVRLDKSTENRLRELSKKIGVPQSVLVRAAVQEKLPRWETAGVQLVEMA